MLLNTISFSNIFIQFSDPSYLQKPDFISLFPIQISTKGNKNSPKRISTVKCTQQKEAEAVSRDKKHALAEWLSKDLSDAAASDPSSNPAAAKFKSVGTPSRPSKSKHSYNPFTPPSSPQSRGREPPKPYGKKLWNRREPSTWTPKKLDLNSNGAAQSEDDGREVVFGENGLAYRLPKAPFEFQYSYTETPKVKPLALREAAFVPFGPTTMPRPWTGRAPLPPSKKKVPEFDSFKLPPPNKKGVKHIQPPGPFPPGEGPKYVKTREEILGEPLTREEVKQLVESSCHSNRQLNMGRDGFTHNMLENIHAHWKRRRVCKIKCKGVATVDMDNICNQLEEKTGGKVIHRAGGAIYLYRGRNYNYKMRPVFPMMLWKPAAAVYPRLIERAPGGLTMEEAKELCQRGRLLPPVCKLAKNGVYSNLVQDVRDAFKVSDLVRVNCQGLKPSDYRKIGAKLKDLVPCVLLSFEYEHILMWRGKNCNAEERRAEAPEAHSDREGSIAESVSESNRSTVMTSAPFDEQLGCGYLASDPSLTKENVLESSSTPTNFFADDTSGDKNGMTVNLEKSAEVEILIKISDDKDKGEVDYLKDKLGAMSFSEVEPEQLTESSEMEIFSDGELNMGVSTSAIHVDTQFLGEDFTCNSQSSFSSKVEVEPIESSKTEVSPDGDSNFSVSAMDTNAHCSGEDSTHNLRTASSSNVELDELFESSKMEVLSDGECDLSNSVSATSITVRCLDEDSTHNSQTLDTLISKQISEDNDALCKSVDADSYNLAVVTADSSNKLTESFSTAAEASTVSEELVASSDEESNLYSDEESILYSELEYAEETADSSNKLNESFSTAAEASTVSEELLASSDEEPNLYSDEESILDLELEYAEETNEQENNGTYDDDGNEYIDKNTVETSQEEGVGLNIEVLWEQAIESGRAMFLYESELEPDSVRERAIAFAKNAPAGPLFKRRFSRKKVGKPWKRNSHVKTKESEGQNPSQINSNNGKEKLLLSSNDLPRGGLPVDELARLLAQ